MEIFIRLFYQLWEGCRSVVSFGVLKGISLFIEITHKGLYTNKKRY